MPTARRYTSILFSRKEIEAREMLALAPYAVKSKDSKGRAHPEKEHAGRTAFQRDRDRVVHSTAFRRLMYKTQVFVNHEGDHYRTRLTHSLEVAQIARTIARNLGLNEDLTEAIALAHDLGHGPFGHAGEWALQRKMKDHGGFEHNLQSLRIVEKLEHSYAEFRGLNLTYEVREGLKKHDYENKAGRRVHRGFYSLEAQVVDVADEIAYDSHDFDDGLRSGLLAYTDVVQLRLWKEIDRYIDRRYSKLEGSARHYLGIRLLINTQVFELLEETRARLRRLRIRRPEDAVGRAEPAVGFSKPFLKKKDDVRAYLRRKMYFHPHVVRMAEKAKRYVENLFDAYLANPGQLDFPIQREVEREGPHRAICDYLAGMTDRFAIAEYKKLFAPLGELW